jgi:hypothetical protein
MKGPLSPSAPMPQSATRTTTRASQSATRRVAFSREVMVRPYYTSSRTEEVKENLWYSPKELRQQRIGDMEVVDMIRQAAASSPSMSEIALVRVVQSLSAEYDAPWCIRGLEALLDGGNQKSQNRLRGVLAVIMEQDRQDMEGEGDDNDISKRYLQVSARCQQEAHQRAMMDRAAVHTKQSKLLKKENGRGVSLPATKLSQFVNPIAQSVSSRAA